MTKKIAIFGATGNLGGCVLNAILNDGRATNWDVSAITHNRSELPERVKIVAGDYANFDSLVRVMEGMDAVVYALPIHVDMALWNANIVRAADFCKVEHLVRFSEPLADAGSPYLPLKVHGEMDVHALGRQFGGAVAVRPNFFMQNFAVYYQPMVKAGKLTFPQGDGRINHVDLRDVGAAVLEILLDFAKYNKECISMTGGAALANVEVADTFSKALGKPCIYQSIDAEAFTKSLISRGLNDFQIQFITELQALARSDAFSYESASISRILKRPPKTFAAFVGENKSVWLA